MRYKDIKSDKEIEEKYSDRFTGISVPKGVITNPDEYGDVSEPEFYTMMGINRGYR